MVHEEWQQTPVRENPIKVGIIPAVGLDDSYKLSSEKQPKPTGRKLVKYKKFLTTEQWGDSRWWVI